MVQPVPSPRRPSGPASRPPGSRQAGKPRPPRHDEWTFRKMGAFLRELAASQSVSQAPPGREEPMASANIGTIRGGALFDGARDTALPAPPGALSGKTCNPVTLSPFRN